MNSGWNHDASPFHAGELAIQERLGLRERMDDLGRRMIRDHLPEQHREFYRALPFLVVATLDGNERPWASLVAGPSGFIESPRRRAPACRGTATVRFAVIGTPVAGGCHRRAGYAAGKPSP